MNDPQADGEQRGIVVSRIGIHKLIEATALQGLFWLNRYAIA